MNKQNWNRCKRHGEIMAIMLLLFWAITLCIDIEIDHTEGQDDEYLTKVIEELAQ